jgi:outer membrane receptor protein involved in Fe transport
LAGAPTKAEFAYVKPEKVTAYEIGYRASFGKFALDVNGYYNQYEDFIGNKTVLVPFYGNADLSDVIPLPPAFGGPTPAALIALSQGDYKPFQVYTNSPADISSYGASLGVSTRIVASYTLGVSYTFAKFDFDQSTDPDYEAGFNTPENKVKVSIGNSQAFKNFGFNINYRWNDVYLWQSTFADAKVAARSLVDVQVNYTVPKILSTFKIGGANIGGDEYYSAPGTGRIGSQYYVSWTVNP